MFERQPTYNPHRTLWQEVLLQTIEDALLGPSLDLSEERRVRTCKAARAYLTTASKDLEQVCQLAGFDPMAVLQKLRTKIAQAPSPEKLAGQARRNNAGSIHAKTPKPKAKRIPFADQQFTIQGTTRTAGEWCARFDVPLTLGKSRLSSGWTPERAFTLTKQEVARAQTMARQVQSRSQSAPVRAHAPVPHYEHDGESLTLTQWANRAGLKKGTLAKRLRCGMTLADALNPAMLRQPNPKQGADQQRRAISTATPRHEHAGESLTLAQWAERAGIPKSTLNKRLRSGYSLAEALTPGDHRGKSLKAASTATTAAPVTPVTPVTNDTADRGVIANFPLPAGTGGVRSAHDFPDLSFSPVTSETPENDRHC